MQVRRRGEQLPSPSTTTPAGSSCASRAAGRDLSVHTPRPPRPRLLPLGLPSRAGQSLWLAHLQRAAWMPPAACQSPLPGLGPLCVSRHGSPQGWPLSPSRLRSSLGQEARPALAPPSASSSRAPKRMCPLGAPQASVLLLCVCGGPFNGPRGTNLAPLDRASLWTGPAWTGWGEGRDGRRGPPGKCPPQPPFLPWGGPLPRPPSSCCFPPTGTPGASRTARTSRPLWSQRKWSSSCPPHEGVLPTPAPPSPSRLTSVVTSANLFPPQGPQGPPGGIGNLGPPGQKVSGAGVLGLWESQLGGSLQGRTLGFLQGGRGA